MSINLKSLFLVFISITLITGCASGEDANQIAKQACVHLTKNYSLPKLVGEFTNTEKYKVKGYGTLSYDNYDFSDSIRLAREVFHDMTDSDNKGLKFALKAKQLDSNFDSLYMQAVAVSTLNRTFISTTESTIFISANGLNKYQNYPAAPANYSEEVNKLEVICQSIS